MIINDMIIQSQAEEFVSLIHFEINGNANRFFNFTLYKRISYIYL
jgi:hypothetical protein